MKDGVTSQGIQASLEAGKGTGTDSPQEPPEGMKACPVRPMLDFLPQEM